jgi:hypothetical protein
MAEIKLIYETLDGKKHSKTVMIPENRRELGIVKQREGIVVIGYFRKPAITHGYGSDNFVIRNIGVPKNTVGGSARLKVGKRIISRA